MGGRCVNGCTVPKSVTLIPPWGDRGDAEDEGPGGSGTPRDHLLPPNQTRDPGLDENQGSERGKGRQ